MPEPYEQRRDRERTSNKRMGAICGGMVMGVFGMVALNKVIFEAGHPETTLLRIGLDYGMGIVGGGLGYIWFRWGSDRFLEWRFRRAARRGK